MQLGSPLVGTGHREAGGHCAQDEKLGKKCVLS